MMADIYIKVPFFSILIGWSLTTRGSIFVLLLIGELQWAHKGSCSKAKLSLIQPLQFSLEQDQIVVSASGISSTTFFPKYIAIPSSSYIFAASQLFP